MGGLFSHPWWLLSLLLVAALIAAYVIEMRRRRVRALRFANLDVLRSVAPSKRSRLKHVPFAILAVGLVLLCVALAGPQAERNVPRNRATVMLVVDVSNSMKATDVAPSRLQAAQAAGKRFADELTSGINLGLVSFAGTASTLVSPTPDHNATKNALGKLKLADKTATGEGIFAALDQIQTLNSALGGKAAAPPAHIVLLSDGKQTVPDSPDDPRGGFTAARKAKEEHIPVSTISFGTLNGTVELPGPNGQTERVPVPVDDDTLRKIANLSGGEFYTASSLDELNKVYSTLRKQIGYERQRGDDSRPWLIGGTLLVLAGTAGALFLNRRLP
ncbi:VWA domain-containing protein [Gordonia sp. PP30]|uniref:VWA domain-containing protein n=1 Tax=unclassified Gordonia (in: high G+C Gram-positive bacteria) TaxID=2657482 RepID=UPI001FFEFFDD|nr:VWA domain-containing protein [Gordonia sp. PP30]UQE76876.1 VWA domain-containing protein [Gordonia sp. PP30]